jgi:hypothetical protein
MSPALTAVIHRIMVRPKNLRPCLRGRRFLLATTLFLAPLHASAAVSVTISPSAVNLAPSGTQQFTATVTGSSDTSVIWTIQEGVSGGTITGSGLYSAPAPVGVYHVVATSHADPTQSATATVGVPGFVQSGLLHPGPCTSTLLSNGTILFTGGGALTGSVSANAEIYDPVTASSTATGSLTAPRCLETATLLQNGKVLLAGGILGGPQTATAELYDPTAGTFTATGSMSAARTGHSATLLPNGKVLIAGGALLNSAELYDPNSGTFSLTGNMVVGASNSTATLLANGDVLVAGGFTSGSIATVVAELYNPATGMFTQTGSMITPRFENFTATLLQSGKVLFVGGVEAGDQSSEVYDPAAGTFTKTGNINLSRERHSATLLQNGQVLIAGGELTGADELYDPGTGIFTLTGNLEEPRLAPSATLLANGTVLIAGGNSSQALGSVEIYDPTSGAFSSRSLFMNFGRTGQSMTKLADGRFLIVGGLDTNGDPVLTAEIFDPTTNKFTLTGSLAAGREMHTTTLLGNGTVLVVGGFPNPGLTPYVSTAELYNPVTGTFGPAPNNPNIARANQTATLLQNGKVLIAGGQFANGPGPNAATPSVELYDPTAGTFTLAGNMLAPRYNHTATQLSDGRVLIAEGVSDANAFSTGVKYAPDELYDAGTGLFTPVGAPSTFATAMPVPFDTVQWPSGQVLVDIGTILDPASLTLSTFDTHDAGGIVNYKFTLLPSNQVFVVGGGVTGETAFLLNPDPVPFPQQDLPTYLIAGNLQIGRSSPSTALLPNGEVLIAAGATVNQVEFYVPPVPAPSPVVISVSPNPLTGFNPVPITIQGANFTSGSVISLDGTAIPTTIVSETELMATIPAITLTVPGGHPILVQNGSGFISAPFTVTVNNPRLGVSQPNGSGISYGSIPAGSSSSQSVIFQNVGNAPLTVDSLSISGPNSADFKFDFANTTCPLQGGILTAQQTCTAAVLFVPLSQGLLNATLTLAFEVLPGSPFVVPLSGTGSGQLSSTLAPTSLTFANQAVGTSSQSQAVTITNTGDVNLNLNSVVLTDAADFSTAYSCPSMINPGNGCSIAVTFSPSALGSISGSLVITTNEPTPITIPLSGTGDNLSLSPASGSSTSATVAAGQPATYKLSLAPQSLSGSVTLTCAPVNPIPNATCSVTPNPATVSGTAATVVTVTVATAAHSGMVFRSDKWKITGPAALEFLARHWLSYLLLALAMCVIANKVRRIPMALATAILLAVLVTGCNASNNSPGGGGSTGTPAGTYQLVVSATSSGATRTIMLTLTVQ